MSERYLSWTVLLAGAGVAMGLAGGLFLGALRLSNSEAPLSRVEWAGNLAFTLSYLAPYLLGLVAFRWPSAWRAAAWGAAAVLSLLGAFTAFSGVSLVLLPAAILLAPAALMSLLQSPAHKLPGALLLSGTVVALVTGAFLSLFMGADDGRCWELVRQPDGASVWQEAPFSESARVTAMGEETGVIRVQCTSDVITGSEAGTAFLLLAGVALVTGLQSRVTGGRGGGQKEPTLESPTGTA